MRALRLATLGCGHQAVRTGHCHQGAAWGGCGWDTAVDLKRGLTPVHRPDYLGDPSTPGIFGPKPNVDKTLSLLTLRTWIQGFRFRCQASGWTCPACGALKRRKGGFAAWTKCRIHEGEFVHVHCLCVYGFKIVHKHILT